MALVCSLLLAAQRAAKESHAQKGAERAVSEHFIWLYPAKVSIEWTEKSSGSNLVSRRPGTKLVGDTCEEGEQENRRARERREEKRRDIEKRVG